MTIHFVDPTAGEHLAIGVQTLRILEDGAHTDHRLGLLEVTIPPRVKGPPMHVHHKHDETFYVVSGVVSFSSGSETVLARRGALLVVPPGTPHTFGNPDDEPATMLNTVTPDLYIDYFRELAKLKPGPHGIDPRDIAELMKRYATEVVGGGPGE